MVPVLQRLGQPTGFESRLFGPEQKVRVAAGAKARFVIKHVEIMIQSLLLLVGFLSANEPFSHDLSNRGFSYLGLSPNRRVCISKIRHLLVRRQCIAVVM